MTAIRSDLTHLQAAMRDIQLAIRLVRQREAELAERVEATA